MDTCYVPWLHMHQPLLWLKNKLVTNVQKMLSSEDSRESYDAKLILRAYKNPARYVKYLRKKGYRPKIMLDFSGILLESLQNLGKDKTLDKIELEGEKIGDIIKLFKEVLKNFSDSIEMTGTAYAHCYFPAIPENDWPFQIEEWKNAYKKIFGKKELERVKGFWFPEMGIPGFEDKLAKLIKTIKESGYEWCILPLQAVDGYERLSLEKRIQVSCQPHLLKVKKQSIPVVFRVPSYFIDQQAGCEANEIYRKSKEAGKIFNKVSKKPALIVPATDGENGNVMMNEFFPNTFVPFFEKMVDKNVSSLTVTEFLHQYYSKNEEIVPESEIKVKTIGASWVSNHRFWLEGTRRLEMVKKIQKLSKDFSDFKSSLEKKGLNKHLKDYIEAKRAFLIAETSCYVYWGTDFWFDQGEKAIELARKKMQIIY